MNSRSFVAFFLVFGILFCLHFNYVWVIYILSLFAAFYDSLYLFIHGINYLIVCNLMIFMCIFNTYVYIFYLVKANDVLKVVVIAQTSDVYQYLVGKTIGINKIGWISKNKTYEGYIYGCILTLITFISFFTFNEILIIYLLGIIGGLISSCIKRFLRIKDYSNLLGDHGGWLDRIDSIILPLFFMYYN